MYSSTKPHVAYHHTTARKDSPNKKNAFRSDLIRLAQAAPFIYFSLDTFPAERPRGFSLFQQ